MNTFFQRSLIFWVLVSFAIRLSAQEAKLTREFKESSIQGLCEAMNNYYVFPEVAKETEKHLLKQWEAGHFTQFETLESFADALTESVQSINHDKHMTINVRQPRKAPDNTTEGWIDRKLEKMTFMRRYNANFKTISKLEGNVGYLDLRGFYRLSLGKEFADYGMGLLSTSDAIIIDLRNNSGGSPEMIFYLSSFFFDKKVQFSSGIKRRGDEFITNEAWTLDHIEGKRLPDVPLYVLTSSTTFSAAEGFTYDMKSYDRVTVVGEVTRGGANPGGIEPINDKLEVFISDMKVVNPITNSNWEGVGIIPDIKTSKEEAYDKAYELAKAAAETYRNKRLEKMRKLLTDLTYNLDNYNSSSKDEVITEIFRQCREARLINEGEINEMGYHYLMQREKPQVAQAIFKSNTVLYPNSANVFDSYAETLALNGDLKGALHNYEKAVEIGRENEDPNLGLFIENLAKIKKRVSENPN